MMDVVERRRNGKSRPDRRRRLRSGRSRRETRVGDIYAIMDPVKQYDRKRAIAPRIVLNDPAVIFDEHGSRCAGIKRIGKPGTAQMRFESRVENDRTPSRMKI